MGRAYHQNMGSLNNHSEVLHTRGLFWVLFLSMRPRQWTKNLIIFFALLFTANEHWYLEEFSDALLMLARTIFAFGLFSALSGAVYLVNDILDIDVDRQHSKKKYRPIASGELSVLVAWAGSIILIGFSIVLSFMLGRNFGWVSLGYIALMLAYSLVLKRFVILDVLAISGGFVMRAVAGAMVLQVPISIWVYICTGLGALLIALSKRRSELSVSGEHAKKQRSTLDQYTTSLLDKSIVVLAPLTLLAYTLYTFTAPNLPDNHSMFLTIPFVAYALFRYMYLVRVKDLGEAPEEILTKDIPIALSIVFWLITAATIFLVFR